MKRFLLLASAATVACLSSTASAEDFSLHLLPGVEVPITPPQEGQVYNPGVSLNTELLFALHPNFAIGPMVEGAYLPRATNTNENAGVLWQLGATARVQGNRTSHGDMSPWLEGNLSYARTGELNRPALGVRMGIDMFTDAPHVASTGPFIGYVHVFQTSQTDSPTVSLLDHRDYNSFQVGWSFNFDFPVRQIVKTHTRIFNRTKFVDIHDEAVAQAPAKPTTFTERVYFNWDSPVIRNWEETDKVDNLINQMVADPFMTVKVEGHASPDGNYQHNVVLAAKRTASVVKYLVDHGVDPTRLTSESFGPDHPFVANTNQEGKERNRRVQFDVSFNTTNSSAK
jgi:outer membrane protein OmpA-like peptidoglycan-associated protein